MSHFLIVDDDPVILHLMQGALLQVGFNVESACNGKIALEKLKIQKFDLLISDIIMPDVTGLDVINFALGENPNLRILAISGGGPDKDGAELLDAALSTGADAILEKPFRPDELVRTVKALMT